MKFKRVNPLLIASVLFMALFLPAAGLAADDDTPTIAVLSFDLRSLHRRVIEAVFDVLHYHDYLSEAEIDSILPNEDFHGKNINVIWRDAGADLPTITIMTEDAIDRGADILVTTTTAVAQTAVNVALESGLEPPPAVIFSLVTSPYSAGIADSPCIKPLNVFGTHTVPAYKEVVDLLLLQDPDLDYIGSFVNLGIAAYVYAYEQIDKYAGELGIKVDAAPWVNAADGIANAEALIDKGVDMFVSLAYPNSLPAIVDTANVAGVPVVSTAISFLPRGAHIAAGFNAYYQEGTIVGQLLTALLDGELDPERTGLHSKTSLTVGLNLDTIYDGDVQISSALQEKVDFVILNGESTESFVKPEFPKVSAEERRAERAAFLDTLYCSDEMIEEQRSQLFQE